MTTSADDSAASVWQLHWRAYAREVLSVDAARAAAEMEGGDAD